MQSKVTLQRYIARCDEIIASGNIDAAKEEQREILAVFGSDLEGLKRGLTNYSAIGAFSHGGATKVVGENVDYIKDLKLLRSRLQAELEKIESEQIDGTRVAEEGNAMRTEIFISHRSIDASVADMIKDFLIATGIPNDKVFCSSLPGNDVNERIGPEVKAHLKNSAINVLILSRDYYESAYCLNEAGVAWYTEDALAIPIGLPEIDHNSMVGFLNSDYKLRCLDNDGDISYLYDQAQERLKAQPVKYSVVTQEILKLKEKYRNHIEHRNCEVTPIEGNDTDRNMGNTDPFDYPPIQLYASVMLFFAVEGGGEILVSNTLSNTSYNAGKVCLNTLNNPRENAKWDSAVEQLLSGGYIKRVSRKEPLFRVTEKGYNISDSFKDTNGLNGSMTVNQVLSMFEDGSGTTERQIDDKDYIREYKELRDEAIYVLSYYANVYTNIVEEPDEEHEVASKTLRSIGVKFEVLASNELPDSPDLPSSVDLKEVSRCFIGLSNNMWVCKGGDIGKKFDMNAKWEEKIKAILKIV